MPRYLVDLHLHSPASNCFSGSKTSLPEIIAAAKRKKLDAIAVTDHHSFDGFAGLKALGAREGILVLPGVELTCGLAGVEEVFILGIFDPGQPLKYLEKLLVELGVPRQASGSGGFIIPRPVEEVIMKIGALGGIAISSRIDKTEYRRAAIPELIKLGVRVFDVVFPEKTGEYFGGFKEYRAGELSFFTFSDSHEAGNTGRRFSSIELPALEYTSFVEKLSKN